MPGTSDLLNTKSRNSIIEKTSSGHVILPSVRNDLLISKTKSSSKKINTSHPLRYYSTIKNSKFITHKEQPIMNKQANNHYQVERPNEGRGNQSQVPISYMRSNLWNKYVKDGKEIKGNYKRDKSFLKNRSSDHYRKEIEFVRNSIDHKIDNIRNSLTFATGRKRRLTSMKKEDVRDNSVLKTRIAKMDPNNSKKLITLSPQKEKGQRIHKNDSHSDFEENNHELFISDQSTKETNQNECEDSQSKRYQL